MNLTHTSSPLHAPLTPLMTPSPSFRLTEPSAGSSTSRRWLPSSAWMRTRSDAACE
jgi:hypothetical protein